MTLWKILGWLGQGLFFARFIVQWWHSERARRTVVPELFWILSIVGTLLVGIYSATQHQWLLLAGFATNTCIYVRNLFMQHARERSPALTHPQITVLACIGAAVIGSAALFELKTKADPSLAWIVVGTLGQLFWSSRFVVQWWCSEREGESRLPAAFWWTSLAGNALLLPYSIHLGDMIFILGFVPGLAVQVRNLMLGRATTQQRSA